MEITRKDALKAFTLALVVTPIALGIFALGCYTCYGLWLLING